MRHWAWIGFLIILLAQLSSCQISGPDDEVSDVSVIRSGTSFGFCVGYCITELTIEPSQLRFSRKSWDRDGTGPPDLLLERSISNDIWNRLINLVDFVAIRGMREVYGCPDCTDGGSEWIEVTHSGETKRVTFEYNAILEPITELVDSLRSIRATFLDELESS